MVAYSTRLFQLSMLNSSKESGSCLKVLRKDLYSALCSCICCRSAIPVQALLSIYQILLKGCRNVSDIRSGLSFRIYLRVYKVNGIAFYLLFEKLGFQRKDLKTVYFKTDTEYENYQDRDKNWKKRLKIYRYTHYMKIEFTSYNKKLGQVLATLANVKLGEIQTLDYP